jgi:hypothetical protein
MSGQISVNQLFDRTYTSIPDANPQKYTTAFDAFTDRTGSRCGADTVPRLLSYSKHRKER